MIANTTRLLVCGLLSLAFGLPANARDRHVLWTVAGKHNTVYLLGSIHVLRATDIGLSEVADGAYTDAEQIVMELDMDDPDAQLQMVQAAQDAAMLPAGQSLRTVLGADYEHVRTAASESGIDIAQLDAFAPWFVAINVISLELVKRGFNPALGIEQTLATRAIADHKPVTGLETAAQQFGVMSSLPLVEQKRFLMMSLDEIDEMDSELESLLGAWRTGDTEKLETLLSSEFDRFPELYKPLTEDRNRVWVDKLVDMLDDDDDYLVVVGALHLVGRNSVVDLLRARGYDVEQQ
jgi:uncharacterized protein YbaP (TraB family)